MDSVEPPVAAQHDAEPPMHENDGAVKSPASNSVLPERPEERFPGLHKQSIEFLENIKGRFGENSQESITIHEALGDFSAHKIPKSEVYFIIFDLLGSHLDLKQDFQAIFHHEDADWDPKDFELPGLAYSTPPAQISPDFLQPQHQPQLPMPPLTTFWHNGSYVQPTQTPLPSINPDLLHHQFQEPYPDARAIGCSQVLQHDLNNEGGACDPHQPEYIPNWHDDIHAGVPLQPDHSSPTQLPPFSTFQQHTSPEMDNAEYSDLSYRAHPYTPQVDETDRERNEVRRNFSLQQFWDMAQYENALQHGHNTGNPHERHQIEAFDIMHHEPTPQLMSPQQSSADATPSVLDTPTVPLHAQPTFVMDPPKKRAKRKAQTEHDKKDEADSKIHSSIQGSTRPAAESPLLPKGRRPSVGTRLKGEYVHSLCGKSFTTRHAVKKHHWGNRLYDNETVTGCWAKHNKPPIEWNEHPSCKEIAPKGRNPSRSEPQTPQPDFTAPTAPMTSTSPNPLPGFPTLQELPQRVVESLTPPYSHMPDDALPYNTSQLQMRGARRSFDTLLTAVNVASSIESPTPQGRNDSVVSHLDAQVASTELQPQHTPYWISGHSFLETSSHDKEHYELPRLSSIGLGIAPSEHVPVAGTSQAMPYGGQPVPRSKIDPNLAMPQDMAELNTSTASNANTVSNESRKRGRRGTRTSGISQKELQGLLDAPSGPERKRVKSLGN